MSKAAKKLRQLYRREVRGSFNIWERTVRDKPWYIPAFIWALVLRIVFKKDAAKILQDVKSI